MFVEETLIVFAQADVYTLQPSNLAVAGGQKDVRPYGSQIVKICRKNKNVANILLLFLKALMC